MQKNQANEWIRHNGSIDYSYASVQPFFRYEGEIKKENWSDSLFTGFKFNDLKGGVKASVFKNLNTSVSYARREEYDYRGKEIFEKESTSNTINTSAQFNSKSFSGTLDFTHRIMNYFTEDNTDRKTDLAELQMQWSPFNRALNLSYNYQISNTATAKIERVYIKVNEGEGNYRLDKDLNEYVNDPLGNYILRILTTDQFEPVAELKTVARAQFEPSRLYQTVSNHEKSLLHKSIEALSSETYFTIDERSQYPDVYNIYFLDLKKFKNPEYTILGTTYFREDFYILRRNRKFSLRYRYENRDELNNQYLQGREERYENHNSLRLTLRFLNRFSNQTEYINKHITRKFNYSGRQDRNIYLNQIESDFSFRPSPILEFSLKGRFSKEKDIDYTNPTRVTAFAIIPQCNYSIRNKGRFRTELEWSFVQARPSDRLIPYEMALGRSLGRSLRWDIRFDYRISDVIMATFSYNGRNEPRRDRLIHAGRAQITASFR
ncbi:MAG: hypothetical protein U5R06_22500 [candidate division KSB1 bacterium]|nr:hypothetical protein [candidate division KSB1 bacterium]